MFKYIGTKDFLKEMDFKYDKTFNGYKKSYSDAIIVLIYIKTGSIRFIHSVMGDITREMKNLQSWNILKEIGIGAKSKYDKSFNVS